MRVRLRSRVRANAEAPCCRRSIAVGDGQQLGVEFLPRRFAVDREIASPGFSTDVGEAQEVEGFGRAIAAFRATLLGVPTELDQPRFLRMQFQAKLG